MRYLPPLFLSLVITCLTWAQDRAISSQSPPGGASSTDPSGVILREGTPVKLKLLHSLNSKILVADDPLNFSLAEDVLVDGKTVVRAGAAAIGRVRAAKPARTLGRGAEMSLEAQYLRAGQTRVPLRGTQMREGADKKGETATLVVLFGLSALIKHGAEIEVKEGSIFTVYVDKDTPLTPEADTSKTEKLK
jgi:hypothetical protein